MLLFRSMIQMCRIENDTEGGRFARFAIGCLIGVARRLRRACFSTRKHTSTISCGHSVFVARNSFGYLWVPMKIFSCRRESILQEVLNIVKQGLKNHLSCISMARTFRFKGFRTYSKQHDYFAARIVKMVKAFCLGLLEAVRIQKRPGGFERVRRILCVMVSLNL